MRHWNRIAIGAAVCLVVAAAQPAWAQSYRLERIASGLNQPTFVTQAPNDPANILYYAERTRNANPGFPASNQMGRVWRYDVNTRTKTEVLSLDQYFVTNDTGLQTIAFHPDFNTPATAGFGKLYISHSEANGAASGRARNRVEEYTVDLSGPNPTYAATFSRLILQYDNNAQNNHTIDWLGFDPTAAGAERDYLYVSTGDGAFGLDYNGGTSPTGRPSQNPNEVAGKMLRVDVVGADAYPGSPLKNFAVPSSNPIPTYNAANPGSPISGLGEVWLTGLRNTYRASFDRQTGDLWMGDVGETTTEEVNFLKAGSNVSGPPVDYGWPQREGTNASGINGTTGATVNPFTGVTSLEPVWQFPRSSAAAAIGGYLYRGPVEELQGKYFYSNFVGTGQIWMLDFDRDTNPASYNGNNGMNTDVSALWQSLVFDPTDPSYGPDSTTGSSAGIDHVVSFGEDNAGNLYVVDFGNGSGFNGQYPGAGLGEIFRIVPNLQIKVAVNRVTGEMVFSNATAVVTDVRGYTLSSAAGAIEPDELTPITGRLDALPSGDGSIDPNNVWQITSAAGDHQVFSEQSTGGAASLAISEQFTLSPADGWIQSIYEDLSLSVVLGNGSVLTGVVEFIGNGGQPFDRSDLNFSGGLDPGDWDIFRAHHHQDMAGLTRAQSYGLGDLDGDGDNDFDDFRLFQGDYIAALGAGAFASLAGTAPEPATGVLLLTMTAALPLFGRRQRNRSTSPRRREDNAPRRAGLARLAVVALAAWCAMAARSEAVLVHQYTFNDGTANDPLGLAHGTLLGNVSINDLGVAVFPGASGDYINLPAGAIGINGYTDATFEAWFAFEGGGTWQRVFDFGRTQATGPSAGQGRDYIFYSPSSGGGDNRAAITDDGGGQENVAVAGPAVSLGIRHHVAVVVDDSGNGGSGRMSVYLNGAFGGDVALTNSLSDVSNALAYLGRSVWNADPNLNGSIDEFRIYNHALTAQEVADSNVAGPVQLNLLELQVNTFTGEVIVRNSHTSPLAFDYYRVTSAAGALSPAGWNSLDAQNVDAIGAGTGQSWDESGGPTANSVAELYLLGATNLAPTNTRSLGNLFDSAVFGKRQAGDLVFEYAIPGDILRQGTITYVTPPPLPGDYNDNGVVDAADYTVWRNHLGASFQLTNEVADVTPGQVTPEDYDAWKARFGDTLAGSGSGDLTAQAGVPEPAAGVLALLAAACGVISLGRSRDC